MSTPIIELKHISREFASGDESLKVLDDINITIMPGEMVAIVGASGSGKSTLMNILGCLDRPTSGTYLIAGRDISTMDVDELSELRREYFGFIFQRYHLLPDLTATANVETPAIYAGKSKSQRRDRAQQLLTRLGLGERLDYRPSQLSGGQQQRVSVARALMNGGRLILADEPTGALDSKSGEELIKIFEELHQEGHTIILVTHNMEVAEKANRIIEIKDGHIISDVTHKNTAGNAMREKPQASQSIWNNIIEPFNEAFNMALLAMWSHRLRTFLTMLGIIIGIASVVTVVALGNGSQQKILSDISSIGTNTIDIFPGEGFGDMRSSKVRTLTAADADALAQQAYVDSVTPSVSSGATLRYKNISVTATINGVGEQFFRVKGYTVVDGVPFNKKSVMQLSQEVVIDKNTKDKLFLFGENPLGKVILLGSVPCRVIGVTGENKMAFGNPDALNVWAPHTTIMTRLLGQQYLRSITVRVKDSISTQAAEQSLTKFLTQRHGKQDFFMSNIDTIKETIKKATATMTLLVSSIAVISLIVGGIGVMNIMMVSVTERTKEIGVRMAVGARRSDIMKQFLIEATLVCLIGGILGVLLALGLGELLKNISEEFKLVYSTTSMIIAFLCATLIGLVFGFLPARNAAHLDPVEALSRE